MTNCPTRWNAGFYQVERFIKLRDCMTLFLAQMSSEHDLINLSQKDCTTMVEATKLLAPLESTTRTLCGDEYGTISLLIPLLRTSKKKLLAVEVTAVDCILFRNQLIRNIEDRFAWVETDNITALATLLDPRFKLTNFESEANAYTS